MKKILMFLCLFSLFTLNVVPAMLGFVKEANATGSTTTGATLSMGTMTGDIGNTLCSAMKFITGSVGKTLASFAVIFLGVTFLAGKCNWVTLVVFTFGVATIFGAPKVITLLTGTSGTFCGSI